MPALIRPAAGNTRRSTPSQPASPTPSTLQAHRTACTICHSILSFFPSPDPSLRTLEWYTTHIPPSMSDAALLALKLITNFMLEDLTSSSSSSASAAALPATLVTPDLFLCLVYVAHVVLLLDDTQFGTSNTKVSSPTDDDALPGGVNRTSARNKKLTRSGPYAIDGSTSRASGKSTSEPITSPLRKEIEFFKEGALLRCKTHLEPAASTAPKSHYRLL